MYAETPVKITPSGTISGDTTSGYTFTGTEITISGSTIAGALDGINISKAYVEGTRTLKSLNDDVATNSAATQANATSITNNTNKINNVDSKYEAITNNIKTDMSTQVSTINTKIDTKLDTTDFGAYTASNDAAVNELKNKTQNIRVDKDTKVTSSDATYIDGITHAGGVRLADKKVRAEELVLEEEFPDGTSAEARLTREGIAALNSMVYDANGKINIVDKKPVIQAGNGSVVGGVKFDNKNITDVDSVMVNKDANNQVQINSEGIVVGLHSTVIGSDGVYAGGHTEATAKAVLGADGSIKGAGDGAGKYKFTVDSSNGTVTINDAGNVATISGGGISIADASGSDYLTMGKGTVVASASVISPKFFVDPNNAFEKNSLKVGDGTKGVTIADGEITTTGNATVGGKLDVTDDTTLKGKLDVTGDTTLKGKLDVTGDISTDGSVTAKGGLSAADGKFTVEGATGNTAVGGTLGVTGAATLGSTLDVTGKATLKDELQVDKKATFGTAAGSQTVINGGDITADGKLTAKSATIGAVGITDTGIVTGVTKLTTKDLDVTGLLNISGDIAAKNISGDSLTVTGAIKGASLEVTGAVTGATINGATITTNSFNGATIGATTFNGVTLTTDGDVSGRNMTASGTITGKEITDGAGASMNAGTVKGKEITDGAGFTANGGNVTAKDINATTGNIAGVQFAANNVSDINNLTATGTIQGAVLKVNDNNLLDSNGLKAEKAVIDNLTIDGASITSNNADGSVGVAGITVDKTGAITGVKAIDGVAVAGNTASGLTIGSGATAVTIGGNSLALSSTNFNVDDDGDVTGKSFKVNGSNYLDSTGLTTGKAVIGGVNTLDGTGISTTGTLDVEGVAKFGKNDADQTKITQGKAEFTQGGKTTTITGGKIETDKLTVNDIVLKNSMKDGAGNTITIKGSDGSMSVASGKFAVDKEGQLTNKITGTASGFSYETNLETSKSGIKANYTNAINGNQNIIDMGASGISIGVVSGTTPSVGAGFKAELDAATMGYGTANSIVVSADTIKSALGTDVTRVMTNSTAEQSIVDKVGTAKRSLKADEIVDEVAGMTVKTNSDGTLLTNGTTTTLINGSAITSTKATGDTGVLNGSNLTLTNGANSTALTAGGATFTGAAGRSTTAGTETTIDGGIITTDTLNVQRIELGEKLVDSTTGETITNSKIYLNNDGSFGAAKGAFQIDTDGQVTNIITETGTDASETTFTSSKTGITAKYRKGTGTGTATSGLTIEDNHAALNASGGAALDLKDKTAKIGSGTDSLTTYTSDAIESKVGDTTVKTKDGSFSVKGNAGNGMDINTNTGKTTFTGSDYNGGASGTTTIDGNTITTGKLVTDKLVIKGNGSGDTSGDGGESGSIAFGGDGTITSNIKDGAKETTFKTTAYGVSSEVTNGTYTSNVDQSADRIGSVITGGNVKIGSVADASLGVLQNGAGTVNASGDTVTEASQAFSKDGSITSVAKDKDGKSSTLVQNGTGLEYTDSAKADNATRINSSDVSIGSATDDSKRINLSDLGQIDDLDSEIQSRDEYKNNQTAVGAINAEAGIRREEVARLDNRIDDVNNRVDKVGAMAAAIASLKSIGYDPQAPSEFSIGLGQYKGETGVAMGFFHYPNKNFMINVSLSTAGGETMGGIGATWRFGHKSPQKLLEEQREAQAKKELAAAEKYQAAAKLAKEAQERAEYAAKLARQAQVSADNAKAAADATQAKHFQ